MDEPEESAQKAWRNHPSDAFRVRGSNRTRNPSQSRRTWPRREMERPTTRSRKAGRSASAAQPQWNLYLSSSPFSMIAESEIPVLGGSSGLWHRMMFGREGVYTMQETNRPRQEVSQPPRSTTEVSVRLDELVAPPRYERSMVHLRGVVLAFVAIAGSACAPLMMTRVSLERTEGTRREEVRRGESVEQEPDAMVVQLGAGRIEGAKRIFEPRVAPRCLTTRVDELRTKVDVSADYVFDSTTRRRDVLQPTVRQKEYASGTLTLFLLLDVAWAIAGGAVAGACFSGAGFCTGEDGQNALITGGAIGVGAAGALSALIYGGALVYAAAESGSQTVATEQRNETEGRLCGEWTAEPLRSAELRDGPEGVVVEALAGGRRLALDFARVRPSAVGQVAITLNGERLPWIPGANTCVAGAQSACKRDIFIELAEAEQTALRGNLTRGLREGKGAELSERCKEIGGAAPSEPLLSIPATPPLYRRLVCDGKRCGPAASSEVDLAVLSNAPASGAPRDLALACVGPEWILAELGDDLERPLELVYMARDVAETADEREARLVRAVRAELLADRFAEAKRLVEALGSAAWVGAVRFVPVTAERQSTPAHEPPAAAGQLRDAILLREGTVLLAAARDARKTGDLEEMQSLLDRIPAGLEDLLVGVKSERDWLEARREQFEARRLESERAEALGRARQAERTGDYESAHAAYSAALELATSEAEQRRIRAKLDEVYPFSGQSMEEFTRLFGDESARRKLRRVSGACRTPVRGVLECALKRRFAPAFFMGGTLAFREDGTLFTVTLDVRAGDTDGIYRAFEFFGISDANPIKQRRVAGRLIQTYWPWGGYQVVVSAGGEGPVIFMLSRAG